MTMTVEDLRSCIGREVVDRDGEKSGKVESVFYDTATNQPAWLAVHTGLFGRHSTLVPLAGAHPEGDTIQVPYDKETIKSAPDVEDDQPIDSKQAAELMEHYGLGDQTTGTDRRAKGDGSERPQHEWMEPGAPTASTIGTDAAESLGLESSERSPETARRDQPATAAETGRQAGRQTDDAMTRSEEELYVGMETHETGHARLRKWIETEPVDRTITVSHEEARVVREPITEANVDRAMKGPDLRENEFEVTLHEEQAVVEKRVVPKERVRLETEKVTEQREIHEELRKEHIDFEGDTPGNRKQRPSS